MSHFRRRWTLRSRALQPGGAGAGDAGAAAQSREEDETPEVTPRRRKQDRRRPAPGTGPPGTRDKVHREPGMGSTANQGRGPPGTRDTCRVPWVDPLRIRGGYRVPGMDPTGTRVGQASGTIYDSSRHLVPRTLTSEPTLYIFP